MRRNRRSGQVFPLFALLLTPLILFVGANADRLSSGIAKIRNQRETDSVALTIANERARALNAIAALNQGLKIASDRGYAVAVALLTLEACTMMLFSSPLCGPALTKLSAKAVPFYRKLEKLGRILRRQQEEILIWADARPREIETRFNLSHVGKAQLFPYAPGPLPVRRSEAPPAGPPGELSSADDFSSGREVRKCSVTRFNTYSDFRTAIERDAFRLGRHDSAVIDYRNPRSGTRRQFQAETPTALLGVRPTRCFPGNAPGDCAQFQNATLFRCRSVYDLLGHLGLASPVKIPEPLQLEDRFFSDGNRLAVARGTKNRNRAFDPLLRRRVGERISRPDLWALSETEIAGGDLAKMEFRPLLTSIHLDRPLWLRVQAKTVSLVAQGFALPVPWERFGGALAH
ncbi:MAG: hypothetical protein V1495_03015 [Pseudomonadota bacterium]